MARKDLERERREEGEDQEVRGCRRNLELFFLSVCRSRPFEIIVAMSQVLIVVTVKMFRFSSCIKS